MLYIQSVHSILLVSEDLSGKKVLEESEEKKHNLNQVPYTFAVKFSTQTFR